MSLFAWGLQTIESATVQRWMLFKMKTLRIHFIGQKLNNKVSPDALKEVTNSQKNLRQQIHFFFLGITETFSVENLKLSFMVQY